MIFEVNIERIFIKYATNFSKKLFVWTLISSEPVARFTLLFLAMR